MGMHMFNRAERQQKSVARLRAKGLTLAQANEFASKQRGGGRPVVLLTALAGVVLMGAGGYLSMQTSLYGEAELATTDVKVEMAAATIPAEPSPPSAETAQPAAIAQSQSAPQTDQNPVLTFTTPNRPGESFDWREASLLASGAIAEEIEPVVRQQVDANDCVDDLRSLASQTVLFFASGETQPVEMDLDTLIHMDEVAKTCPAAQIVVAGHSDASGTPALNLELSWQRADATMEVMRAIGIDVSRFEPIGFGARLPLAQGSAEDDDVNRRVELDVRRVDAE